MVRFRNELVLNVKAVHISNTTSDSLLFLPYLFSCNTFLHGFISV